MPMTPSQILRALRARWRTVAICTAATVAVVLGVTLLLPRQYTATTQLIVDSKATDPVTGLTLPAQMLPGYLATQVDIITSSNVARRVVDRLQLAQRPAWLAQFRAGGGRGEAREWLAEAVRRRLEVKPARDSNVITIQCSGSDPKEAAELANAVAEAYVQASLDLRTQPARQMAQWFDGQLATLRQTLEAAQARLSAFQQQSGIVAGDERIDVENARLDELSTLAVTAEGQRADAQSRSGQLGREQVDAIPDVLANPLIQTLKGDLARADAKLAELSARLGERHPQYRQAKSEADALRGRLASEIATAGRSLASNARIGARREDALRQATAAQKTRVLELRRQRDRMAVLARDVESAQHAYDAALQRAAQNRMQGQMAQTDIAVLNPASPPARPSSPRPALNALLALALGLFVGVAVALGRELARRRVRSAEDLLPLGLPVLASIESARPPAPRRAAPTHRQAARARP